MAFMVPVMKNDYDLYRMSGNNQKTKRSDSRTSSGPRSRKISETRSECQSLATSPQDRLFNKYYASGNLNLNRRGMRSMPSSQRPSRLTSVRASQVSLPCSPSKLIQDDLPEKPLPPSPKSPSENSMTKFHVRLMERLRRSLRISVSTDDDECDKPDSPTGNSPK